MNTDTDARALMAANPRFGYGGAILAGQTAALSTLFASMVAIPGSDAGGRNGTFTTRGSATEYVWVAVVDTVGLGQCFWRSDTPGQASPPIPFFLIDANDPSKRGGFNGAGLSGAYAGANTDPATAYLTFVDSTGIQWRLYRSSALAVAGSYTLS